MATNTPQSAIDALRYVIDSWVRLSPVEETAPDRVDIKIDILERVLEVARLRSGKLINHTRMADLLSRGVGVEPQDGVLYLASKPDHALEIVDRGWPAPNERVPAELQPLLLLFLLRQYRRPQRIHDTIEHFVSSHQCWLTPLDAESTLTGVPRVVTNTRVAANALRNWALLQDSSRTRYKSWELTHFGILAAAVLSRRGTIGATRVLRMSHGGEYLAEPVAEAVRSLTRIDTLVQAVKRITCENADVLSSFEALHSIVSEYAALVDDGSGEQNPAPSREAAAELLRKIESALPVDTLADDFAVDEAIRSVT